MHFPFRGGASSLEVDGNRFGGEVGEDDGAVVHQHIEAVGPGGEAAIGGAPVAIVGFFHRTAVAAHPNVVGG